MRSFKEQLTHDLAVFVNDNEFASAHTVNGVEVKAIVESPTTEDYYMKSMKYAAFEGIGGKTAVLHIATECLPDRVVHGNILDLDGEIYRVANVTEDMGITSIVLEVNEV